MPMKGRCIPRVSRVVMILFEFLEKIEFCGN